MVAYSSSVLDLRFPSAYCDELANCAIEFIVEYPCLDKPPPKTVAAEPAGGPPLDWADDDDDDDVVDDKLPAFWNFPNRELPRELGGGTAFIEYPFEFWPEFDAECFGGPPLNPLR